VSTDHRERLQRIASDLRSSGQLDYILRHGLGDLVDIVASLLPADEAAAPYDVALPAIFTDGDGDRIEIDSVALGPIFTIRPRGGVARAAILERDDVDRFIAAVRKAAGR
jgi:hypothetical protein